MTKDVTMGMNAGVATSLLLILRSRQGLFARLFQLS